VKNVACSIEMHCRGVEGCFEKKTKKKPKSLFIVICKLYDCICRTCKTQRIVYGGSIYSPLASLLFLRKADVTLQEYKFFVARNNHFVETSKAFWKTSGGWPPLNFCFPLICSKNSMSTDLLHAETKI
jgi:hypothetical protein